MLNYENIEKYRESNRIEAKKATGGLPHSIWETYSAFANTLGGVILLGVREDRDRSFHAEGLKDPEGMIREFWELINSKKIANKNILERDDIKTFENGDKRMIAITVPRAKRSEMPIYIFDNIWSGTHRRSGDGDYRCSKEEIEQMLRLAKMDIAPADSALVDMLTAKGELEVEEAALVLFVDEKTAKARLERLVALEIAEKDGNVYKLKPSKLLEED